MTPKTRFEPVIILLPCSVRSCQSHLNQTQAFFNAYRNIKNVLAGLDKQDMFKDPELQGDLDDGRSILVSATPKRKMHAAGAKGIRVVRP